MHLSMLRGRNSHTLASSHILNTGFSSREEYIENQTERTPQLPPPVLPLLVGAV